MKTEPKVILILGGTGMLGHVMLRLFAQSEGYRAYASVRSATMVQRLPENVRDCIISGVDVENFDSLTSLFSRVKPDVVVNCIGLVKQIAASEDPIAALTINSLLPHRLARLSQTARARFIHISTDCVFDGAKGGYVEQDRANATDLYGRTKFLGEVNEPSSITLRTSIIGPELGTNHGLIGWFLSQRESVKGFRRAVFSGVPTVELAAVIRDFVIPHESLTGLYHVSAEPISKHDLLRLVAKVYDKDIEIQPDDALRIDRSLDSSRFTSATSYRSAPWTELVERMYRFG